MPHNSIRTACFCLLTAGALWLGYQVNLTLNVTRSALQGAGNSLPQVIQDADSAVKKFSQATDDLSGVIAAERKAQTSQLRESQKVIAAVKEAVVRTNCQLNGGPGCRGLLPQATTTLEDSAQQIQLLAKSGQDTLQSASFLLNSANRRIQDQRINQIYDGFSVAALHLGGTMSNVEDVSRDLKIKTDQFVAPQSLKSRIFWTSIDLIKIGGVAAPWFLR